jgi:hypothetical protein
MLNLPSTNRVNDVTYVRKLIFRINNRVYLNFECKKHNNASYSYSIYLNYNHDNSVDYEASSSTIKKIIEKLAH